MAKKNELTNTIKKADKTFKSSKSADSKEKTQIKKAQKPSK